LKKLTAILLLSIHFFSLAGYTLLIQHLMNNADRQLEQSLDKMAYNDKDLIEVSVPLNMPYLTNTNKFERTDGQLELNGIHYNYVKRKISNDTLYVLCIPNISKTKLLDVKLNYANQNSDNPSGKNNAESPVKKWNFGNDYSCTNNEVIFFLTTFSNNNTHQFNLALLPSAYIKAPAQPPDYRC
jgi:hypothetical protein